MKLTPITPNQSINKAYRKEKVGRSNIELFKRNLKAFLASIDEKESEEHVKNNVTRFLYETYYQGKNQINTKGRIDLAIYEDKKPVVIIEAKRPSSPDMVSVKNLNSKAMHELMLYYLRERIDEGNTDIKFLIATNMYEWFVFDASVFDKLFYQNSALTKEYVDWKNGRKPDSTTDFFYTTIASKFLKDLSEEIAFTWFDLRDIEKVVLNDDPKDDNKLIPIFKLLSPAHLLKQPFANDSNSLDTKFYSELLHIIGLEEKKDGGKKLIQRKEKPDEGSLLENAINNLIAEDHIQNLPRGGADFGETKEDRLFNVALELCITWINRILFLKLLEGQLQNYHEGDSRYRFLDFKTIPTYDELNKLFFQVLAREHKERTGTTIEKFKLVPYLNSSLFEPSPLEHGTLRINNLDDGLKLKLFSSTVLKNNSKKREGELPTLQYLFEFLNSYDFTSEGKEQIQEENKGLINASVLGLIFEKINGYKDGSFFTPGFITMYMCRETIRRAVVQKFKEAKGWEIDTFDDLHNHITPKDIKEANEIINSLKICDPAVGSGHFLVSALNEIITIKSELGVLADQSGKVLRGYAVEVINDELIVSIDHNEFFEYKPGNKDSQRVQETLFHEKQTIIENCLFGVDINPNSVKICRLRLWIELLKNAYYTTQSKYTELETLPNIDINIKQGNSLISRFPLDADLSKALKSIKYSIDDYRSFVNSYKNATDKEEKRGFETLINQIKTDFRTEIAKNDPLIMKRNKLGGELYNLLNQAQVFEPSEKEKKDRDKKKENLEAEIKKLSIQIDEIKDSAIYKDAFEWRFEFPEVLDGEGKFIGFDAVIGNPPYIRQEGLGKAKEYLSQNYDVYQGTADLLVYFFEIGIKILRREGILNFITSNKFMKANYGKNIRSYLYRHTIESIIDFGELPVFEEAATFPAVFLLRKSTPNEVVNFAQVKSLKFDSLYSLINSISKQFAHSSFSGNHWHLSDNASNLILTKMINLGITLGEYTDNKIYWGIKTGFNEAFVIDEEKRNQLVGKDKKSAELIYPFAIGDDIRRYEIRERHRYIILTKIGVEIEKYPAILKHLTLFKEQLDKRYDKGDHWYELRACAYYDKFEGPKIVYPEIAKEPRFAFSSDLLIFNNKAFFIPLDDKFLLGYLNSKLTWFYLKKTCSVLGDPERGGRLELRTIHMETLPVPKVKPQQAKEIAQRVEKILALKKKDMGANVSALEEEIDHIVYQLNGLTDEEVKIIES